MPEISEFFRVTTRIQAGGVAAQNFGLGLLITSDASIPAGGPNKAQKFSTILAVGEVFDSASDPYKAAQAWFSQDPIPQELYIGRWATSDIATTLFGETPDILTALQAVTAGSFVVGSAEITAVDLSGAGSFADVAGTIQTAIQAAGSVDSRLTGVTFTYSVSDTRFELTLATGADLGNGYFGDATTGTALATLLGMNEAVNPTYAIGSDQETIAGCIDNILAVAPDVPYFVMLDNGVPSSLATEDTSQALSERVEAGRMAAFIQETTFAALASGDVTSDAALAFADQYARTFTIYSGKLDDHKHISGSALYSAQNFDQPNSVITGMGKTLPGQAADRLNDTQFAELKRKRVNSYTFIGGLPTLAEGWMAQAGVWSDARIWLDWIANELELSLWNLVRSVTKIPATGFGVAIIKETLATVMEKGVRNGGIGPGLTVSPAMKADIRSTTGNHDFDGVLVSGYLIHVGRLSLQTQVDRDNRLSPPIKIWAKGSSAIHRANVDLIFEN